MTELYKQCDLRRGATGQTAWIPAIFAKVGAVLRIGKTDGWRVTRSGRRALGDDVLAVRSEEHRRHRYVTDV